MTDEPKIQEYVMKTIKNYFRTTFHNGIEMESKLSEHGLDKYDIIEIAM